MIDYQKVVDNRDDCVFNMVCLLFAECKDCPRNRTDCNMVVTAEQLKEAFEKQTIEIQKEHAAFVKARMEVRNG